MAPLLLSCRLVVQALQNMSNLVFNSNEAEASHFYYHWHTCSRTFPVEGRLCLQFDQYWGTVLLKPSTYVLCWAVLGWAGLGFAVLRCAVLCSAVLSYAMLACAVLCLAISCLAISCLAMQHCAVLCSAKQRALQMPAYAT